MSPKSAMDTATGIAKIVNDPVLIVLTIVIISLLIFIFYLVKMMEKRISFYGESIHTLSQELHENGLALVKLTTLMEVLIHGRKNS